MVRSVEGLGARFFTPGRWIAGVSHSHPNPSRKAGLSIFLCSAPDWLWTPRHITARRGAMTCGKRRLSQQQEVKKSIGCDRILKPSPFRTFPGAFFPEEIWERFRLACRVIISLLPPVEPRVRHISSCLMNQRRRDVNWSSTL